MPTSEHCRCSVALRCEQYRCTAAIHRDKPFHRCQYRKARMKRGFGLNPNHMLCYVKVGSPAWPWMLRWHKTVVTAHRCHAQGFIIAATARYGKRSKKLHCLPSCQHFEADDRSCPIVTKQERSLGHGKRISLKCLQPIRHIYVSRLTCWAFDSRRCHPSWCGFSAMPQGAENGENFRNTRLRRWQ